MGFLYALVCIDQVATGRAMVPVISQQLAALSTAQNQFPAAVRAKMMALLH
jgi:hypothetical protein